MGPPSTTFEILDALLISKTYLIIEDSVPNFGQVALSKDEANVTLEVRQEPTIY